MNRAPFETIISEVAEKSGKSTTLVADILADYFSINAKYLCQNKMQSIPGVGTFKLRWHDSYKSINPKTKEEYIVEAHHTARFHAAKQILELLEAIPIVGDESEPFPIGVDAEASPDPVDVTAEFSTDVPEPDLPTAESDFIFPPPVSLSPPPEPRLESALAENSTPDITEPIPSLEPLSIPESTHTKSPNPISEPEPSFAKINSTKSKVFIVLILVALAFAFVLVSINLIKIYFISPSPKNSIIQRPGERSSKPITKQIANKGGDISPNDPTAKIATYDETISSDLSKITKTKFIPFEWGDTLASIAAREYGSSLYWPYIYFENIDTIKDPDILVPVRDRIILTYQTNISLAELYLKLYYGYTKANKKSKALQMKQILKQLDTEIYERIKN